MRIYQILCLIRNIAVIIYCTISIYRYRLLIIVGDLYNVHTFFLNLLIKFKKTNNDLSEYFYIITMYYIK